MLQRKNQHGSRLYAMILGRAVVILAVVVATATGCSVTVSEVNHVVGSVRPVVRRLVVFDELGDEFAANMMPAFDAGMSAALTQCGVAFSVIDVETRNGQSARYSFGDLKPDYILFAKWTERIKTGSDVQAQTSTLTLSRPGSPTKGAKEDVELWKASVSVNSGPFADRSSAGTKLARAVAKAMIADALLGPCSPPPN